MEKIQLQAQIRDIAALNGKKLQKQGLIPMELYGHKLANLHLAMSSNAFEKVLRKAGESTIVEVITPDGGVRNVLIQAVQRHYLTNRPIHADLYAVDSPVNSNGIVAVSFSVIFTAYKSA